MHLKITDAPYFVKIPIRLKIPASLKISVQWCSGAICPESCKGIQGEPERMQEHTTTTRPPEENRRATKGERQRNFLLIYRYNCTKSKIFAKKLKKVWKFNFLPYLCSRNQTTNTPKGKKKIQTIKLQSNENNQQHNQTGRALY